MHMPHRLIAILTSASLKAVLKVFIFLQKSPIASSKECLHLKRKSPPIKYASKVMPCYSEADTNCNIEYAAITLG
jgi:hypothetical protein